MPCKTCLKIVAIRTGKIHKMDADVVMILSSTPLRNKQDRVFVLFCDTRLNQPRAKGILLCKAVTKMPSLQVSFPFTTCHIFNKNELNFETQSKLFFTQKLSIHLRSV